MISTDELKKFVESHPSYKNICLQFPDELLNVAADILLNLRSDYPDRYWSILADTSFGSCCVDEVAADHVSANLIVHFGRSCLSRPSRIDTFHVFGRSFIDRERIIKIFHDIMTKNKDKSRLLVFMDLEYQYAFENGCGAEFVEFALAPRAFIPVANKCVNDDKVYVGRRIPKDLDNSSTAVLYIGNDENFQTALAVDFYGFQVFTIDPETCEYHDKTVLFKKKLMKRYAAISKSQNEDIIGILVGTLGVEHYFELIEHLKRLINAAGKRSYVILVGKLNPAKLANFSEISVFVNVSCPLSCIVDDKEFYQTIITPFELEVALGIRQWDLESYETSFEALITGVESINILRVEDEITSRELVAVESENALIQSGLNRSFHQRTWYGLEIPNESELKVELAKEGRRGVARGYE